MEQFDSTHFHSNLVDEFRKLDEILELFQNQFREEILSCISTHYPEMGYNEDLEELVLTYSNQIFNTAESVYDKDKNYNEIRLNEEVVIMNKVVNNLSESVENRELGQQLHQKAKEMMVCFNPELMDLSADGFRLLEKYALMYNLFFLDGFDTMSRI